MKYAPDNLEFCPEHPDARVRRVYDQTVYTLNQVETHVLSERTVGYECSACSRVLNIHGRVK